MDSNSSDRSLFASVKAGAETGAALGKHAAGIVGIVAGGFAGAVAGCIYWIATRPFQSKEA